MTILDTNTPIIILFGPPVCGKTMMLLHLTRYLECIGYRVEPDYAFIAAMINTERYVMLIINFVIMIRSLFIFRIY